ncbi:MAG: hypothetical protein OHK005_20480 [Candidatus Methylacidiphilales bacterium]
MRKPAFWTFIAASCFLSRLALGQTVETVDGVKLNLNDRAWATVVLYSNQRVQRQTRAAGQIFDPLQGKARFRLVVVVDLRGSLANWAPGYTIRTIQRDLDQEASRVEPFFKANRNLTNPRASLHVVADFTGQTCTALGWPRPLREEQILFYPRRGPHRLWKPPFDPDKIRDTVLAALR